MLYIIMLGAPGAGKGTQAGALARKLNLVHIATGDLFRKAVGVGTELGLIAKSYMEKGLLVPDEITIRILLERMNSKDAEKGAILDGFPRNLAQAEALDEALRHGNKSINEVIYIKVATEKLTKRLSGRWICRNCQTPFHVLSSPPRVEGKCDLCGGELYQRDDDKPETIKKRIKIYLKEIESLVSYYAAQDKLVMIDGEGSIDEVAERIMIEVVAVKK
jgi:adenylate kinase